MRHLVIVELSGEFKVLCGLIISAKVANNCKWEGNKLMQNWHKINENALQYGLVEFGYVIMIVQLDAC